MNSRKDLVVFSSFLLIVFLLAMGAITNYDQQKHIEVLEEELIYNQVEMQGIRNSLSIIEDSIKNQ